MMGKRGMERMTGMTQEERIVAAIKRKAEEEKRQKEIAAENVRKMLEFYRNNVVLDIRGNRIFRPTKDGSPAIVTSPPKDASPTIVETQKAVPPAMLTTPFNVVKKSVERKTSRSKS